MQFKLTLLLLVLSLSLNAQGSFGIKLSFGFSDHGFYNSFDEGAALPAANSKFLLSQSNQRTSNFLLGISYHINKIRIEANINIHSEVYISSSIFPDYYDIIRRGNTIHFNPLVGSVLFYRANYRPNRRITLQPGIGLGLTSYGINPYVSSHEGGTDPLSLNAISFNYSDKIHESLGYQLIAALEINMKMGRRHFLFINGQYHLGLHKMFTREISYFLNEDQEQEFKAQQVYDGSSGAWNCGVRFYFNDAHNYKLKE